MMNERLNDRFRRNVKNSHLPPTKKAFLIYLLYYLSVIDAGGHRFPAYFDSKNMIANSERQLGRSKQLSCYFLDYLQLGLFPC